MHYIYIYMERDVLMIIIIMHIQLCIYIYIYIYIYRTTDALFGYIGELRDGSGRGRPGCGSCRSPQEYIVL